MCRSHCLHFQTVPDETTRDCFMGVTETSSFKAAVELQGAACSLIIASLEELERRRDWVRGDPPGGDPPVG